MRKEVKYMRVGLDGGKIRIPMTIYILLILELEIREENSTENLTYLVMD